MQGCPCRSGPPQWPPVTLRLPSRIQCQVFLPAWFPAAHLGSSCRQYGATCSTYHSPHHHLAQTPFPVPPPASLLSSAQGRRGKSKRAKRRHGSDCLEGNSRILSRGRLSPASEGPTGRGEACEAHHDPTLFAPGTCWREPDRRPHPMQPRERLTRALAHATAATPYTYAREREPRTEGNRFLSRGRHFPSLPQSTLA